jgi:hypothetical protein
MKYILLFAITTCLSADLLDVENLYNAKNYEGAIQEARASKTEYSNPKLHLFWAKSAEALGRDDEAMSAYERVVMLDENNIDARVSLAQLYNKTDRAALANESKKELENFQLTPQQRNTLGLISGEDINKVKAQAKLGLGYDTNLNVLPDDEKSSLFTRLSANASYINELKEKGGWNLRADMKLYYQNNIDAHLYDIFVGGLDLGFGYVGDGYSIQVPLGYDMVNYLDVNLLDQLRFQPKVNIKHNDFIFNINTKYSQRNFKKSEHKSMNDSSLGFGGGMYYILGKDFAYANLNYETFSADDSSSVYIDRDLLKLSMGVNHNPNDYFLVTKVDYKYKLGNYDGDATTKKRKDNNHQLELKISHYLKKKLEFYVSLKYVKNSSNYDQADYTKSISMLGLSTNY